MTPPLVVQRRALVPDYIGQASRAYIGGRDSECEAALATALALIRGHQGGLQ